MPNYNPFAHLAEHPSRPLARFWRSRFIEKCLDTFVAFFGKQNSDLSIDMVGLCDYLSLWLLPLMHQFFLKHYQKASSNFQSAILMLPLTALNLCAWLFKLASSLLLSGLCLPIIIICHQASLLFGGQHLKEQALSLTGEDFSSYDKAAEHLSLANFLDLHQRVLSDFEVNLTITEPNIAQKTLHNVGYISNKLAEMTYLKAQSDNKKSNPLNASLSFIYYHPESTPWLSNFNFLFSSVAVVSLFPWLAAMSAKQIAHSATDRAQKILWGRDKDWFQITVDMTNQAQLHQLSALFQLNVSDLLSQLENSTNQAPTATQEFRYALEL